MVFKKKKVEKTPSWAIAAQLADQIKKLCEEINDVTYLTALKSIVDRLQKYLDAKLKKLEGSK